MAVDVTILGAGPCGLTPGARLRQIKRLGLRIFGELLEFWHTFVFVCPTGYATKAGAPHSGHRISKWIRLNLLLS